jgi:E3 ubiquitin-protein ligase SHPRH
MKQQLKNAKEGKGPAPELMIKLLAERETNRVKITADESLRGMHAQLRQMISTLQWQQGASGSNSRASTELEILEGIFKHVTRTAAIQTKVINELEHEINAYRDTMNSRLEYYRALQRISDTVAPYREDDIGKPFPEDVYRLIINEEQKAQQKCVSLSAKLRYLIHMKAESTSTVARTCIICTDPFEVGSITTCGHTFCKECLQLWYTQHRNCPVCKTRLPANGFHDITYKPSEIAVQAESPSSSEGSSQSTTPDRKQNQSIYSDISTSVLNQIKNFDVQGPSFGSKIDFLCRHLLWIRANDPGSKSIIFSQYREFLDVLGGAFHDSKIHYTRIDSKGGIEQFKSNPAVECFLLHAKAHSAGLNLVVANHVFLCEPLINTAIELQAIARVHRIGQHRATNVWMYLIADTIEEAIYDISVTRRLAHMKSNTNSKGKKQSTSTSKAQSGTATPATNGDVAQETAIDVANSMELQAANLAKLLTAGKSGGEIVEKADLWGCLFGKGRKSAAQMADEASANSDVGRFLRAEAAEGRMDLD